MLEKLRAKPDHIKKNVSLFLTTCIFCGILFVWVSSWDARIHDEENRSKTLSPIAGVTSMFEGLITNLNDKISGAPSYVDFTEVATSTVSSTATSSNNFDISGVVVLDSSATSTPSQ